MANAWQSRAWHEAREKATNNFISIILDGAAFVEDLQSRFWFTYRKNFRPIGLYIITNNNRMTTPI